MLRLFSIYILLHCSFLKAQDPKEYDSIYRKIYLDISQKDFEKSLQLADSLFQISKTPLFKTKSLMLTATLHQQAGEVKKALQYALDAEKQIQTTDYLDWKARVYGFLATEYRFIGLFSESKKYLDKTEDVTSKVKNESQKKNLLSFIYQEKAYHELEKKNYHESLGFCQLSSQFFDIVNSANNISYANNLHLIGLNYYYLNQDSLALKYYHEALEIVKNHTTSYHYSIVNNAIANVHLDANNLEKAKYYLDEAKTVSQSSNYLHLKVEVLKSLEKYYLKTKDLKKLKETQESRDSLTQFAKTGYTIYLDETFKGLNENTHLIKKKNQKKNILIILTLLLLLGCLMGFLFYRFQKKKEHKKIQQSIKELELKLEMQSKKQGTNPLTVTRSRKSNSLIENENKNKLMTEETEIYLINKLSEFESSTLFLKKNISLSFLASEFATNTKYLSYIINIHKGKDFNNYINELKIIYIIKKLNEDPQYLLYKISALSEETGFSSQSKFAAAFKKLANVSPSDYIKELRKKYTVLDSNV
jgi:AraC-like DNA-binding protein